MQTALHIMALVAQLKEELVGGKIVSTEFYRKERTAFLFIKREKTRVALGLGFHPAGFGCYCVPASKVKLESREKPWPFFSIENSVITAVEQRGLDRIFHIDLELADKRLRLLFEATGPNGNILLLDESDKMQATLRKREIADGAVYQVSLQAERANPLELSGPKLLAGLTESGSSALFYLEKQVAGFNRTMAREVLVRGGTSADDCESTTSMKLAETTRDLAGRFKTTETGYLYIVRGRPEAFPFKLTSVTDPPQKFKTLSLAILAMTKEKKTTAVEDDDERQVLAAVGRTVKRMVRRIEKVKQDVAQAGQYERYKHLAELLQLNRDQLKKGQTEIELEDYLSGSEGSARIVLDPALSPNDNIERYFRKHRKGREGLALLERRLEISQSELVSLQQMESELQTNFPTAREKYAPEIVALSPGVSVRSESTPRLPYRPAKLSSGVTIFIGKDGTDNDRTTFEFARPYELWFHTQQCPGSHVVLKFPNKSFEPSKREIEETAAIAAFHSKARNDSLVPVIYCQRKYVRKPRKAKPGLVTVEREKSVMVVPTAAAPPD